MRILLAGWFSFEQMGVTAGALLARALISKWLTEAQIAHEIALALPFEGGVDWQ